MRIEFKNMPIDLILCMIWSLIFTPILLLNIQGTIRIILGLPIIIFIPGYVLIFALFPSKKTNKEINIIERFGLALGLSIAILPLITIGFFYTPWGIKLGPILFAMYLLIICFGSIAMYRWVNTEIEKRFTISFNLSTPKFEDKLHIILTVILAVCMITAALYFVYVLSIPKSKEKFTEFYWLGPSGITGEYQRNLSRLENSTIIIGLSNHEYKYVNYTIEVWLINYTLEYNESSKGNDTVIGNMWFRDKMNVALDHSSFGIEETWRPQWEKNYSFNIDKKGEFKLVFLLFTHQTEEYDFNQDYKLIADNKFNQAYMDIYLHFLVF